MLLKKCSVSFFLWRIVPIPRIQKLFDKKALDDRTYVCNNREKGGEHKFG